MQKVRSERYEDTVGLYGLEEGNERGQRLIEFCEKRIFLFATDGLSRN